MHDSKVPGRHHVPGLCVPHWRDIPVWSTKYNDRGLSLIESLPLCILARDVAVNRSIDAYVSVQKHRNVSDAQRGGDCYEINEREFLHEVMEKPPVLNLLGFGDVERLRSMRLRCGILGVSLQGCQSKT